MAIRENNIGKVDFITAYFKVCRDFFCIFLGKLLLFYKNSDIII